ncbi:MAG: glycoside hydrolase 43 family protein [Dysgonamonadaceae bacterium]|nr:glycoside hydrolase 43 family protein [Dysgonamonadaceae bacterium]
MKNRFLLCCVLAFFSANCVFTQTKTGSWGDQGNGTFINPVLNADYSDPDVIRVGEKYYMVCSEFHFMGIPVLESDDMVNWRIIAQVYSRFDRPQYDNFEGYGRGSWAPALRYHDGKFWLFFCTPNDGLFMSNATKPEGPWSPLVCLYDGGGWEDPCPFWDNDGKAYLGHSRVGAGPIIIHRMQPDGTRLLDDGVTVYTGPVAEGTKFLKRDGYYYLSIPEGGVETGWQTILRSKNIFGPYEKKVVFERGSTAVNGPHQGSLVDTPEGEWWFYHFQSSGAMGRVVHLQPVRWLNGWPEMGVDIDRNGIGEPVYVWKKPIQDKPITAPQTDDNFNGAALGLQWQFNHNPDNSLWSLSNGVLHLKAAKAESLTKARNTLTQKLMGTSGTVTVTLNFSRIADGQKAGLACMSDIYSLVGVSRENGKNCVYYEDNAKNTVKQDIKGKKIYLRIRLDLPDRNRCYYSLDNKKYLPLGEPFKAQFGFWKGARIALFSYNTSIDSGEALFDDFVYDYDGPKGL